MKKPNPMKTAQCNCFAHSEDECQYGAWYKPAPMVWHKLSDERPTERGVYILRNKSGRYMLEQCSKSTSFIGVTHWCLITPPEREGK